LRRYTEDVRDLNQLHRRINKGAPPLPLDVRCSQPVRSLLVSMPNQEPSRRPTMTQVLVHPALKVGPRAETAQEILCNAFDTLVGLNFLRQMPPGRCDDYISIFCRALAEGGDGACAALGGERRGERAEGGGARPRRGQRGGGPQAPQGGAAQPGRGVLENYLYGSDADRRTTYLEGQCSERSVDSDRSFDAGELVGSSTTTSSACSTNSCWNSDRGLHSSTFRHNISTFCWILWVHDFPPVRLADFTRLHESNDVYSSIPE
jgi:hypothetical protein